MNLIEYQRALIHGSFAAEESEPSRQVFADPARFRLYRHMIRTRLHGMVRVAFRQARALVGEQSFEASFDRYLARKPPRSPLIRDVIAGFGPFARGDTALLEGAAGQLSDLLWFEEAKWRLAYQPCQRPRLGEDGVRELDFEGAPVLNPLLERLTLAYPVHTLAGEGTLAPIPTTLLVYRPDGIDEVRWCAADPLFAAILQRAAQGSETLAELVRAVAEQQGRALDEALLESLASSLTLALQRGVLIGVR